MKPRALSALLLALALGSVARAAPASGEPEACYPGEVPTTWDTPPSREQAARDATLTPVGKGAIFVPAMTDAAQEPSYLVKQDGREVRTARMGTKAIVEPGVYVVEIGSGALSDRFERRVLVKEGRTTIVPGTWSGLVVSVVDERGVPFRGSYELVRLPERRNLGLGLGADVELGEELRTWILEPGRYLLIKTGESYQARRDFYSVRLLPGELQHIQLVQSVEDGSFLGAGEISDEQRLAATSDWLLNLVVGADMEFNRRSDLLGYPSGYGFTLGGYLDFVAQYKPRDHLVYTRFKLEEKQVKLPGAPFVKDLDELRVDALYVWRLLPWLGPYARIGTQTSLFPGYYDLGSDKTEVVLVDAGGGTIRSLGTHDGRFELQKPFAPVEVKGGVGLSLILSLSYLLDANVRVGFGGRLLFNRGLLSGADDGETEAYEVFERGDAYQYGLETTVVASLRLTRWVLATTEFEFLEPVDDPKNPIIDWETTVGLRLVSFVSLNYIFKLLSDVERSDHLQTEHRVLLRFTWDIL